MKVDQQVLEAFARVNVQEPNLVKWFEARLAEHQNDAIMQRDDVAMRWAQGRGQEILDILKMLNGASEYLRKAH